MVAKKNNMIVGNGKVGVQLHVEAIQRILIQLSCRYGSWQPGHAKDR